MQINLGPNNIYQPDYELEKSKTRPRSLLVTNANIFSIFKRDARSSFLGTTTLAWRLTPFTTKRNT